MKIETQLDLVKAEVIKPGECFIFNNKLYQRLITGADIIVKVITATPENSNFFLTSELETGTIGMMIKSMIVQRCTTKVSIT